MASITDFLEVVRKQVGTREQARKYTEYGRWYSSLSGDEGAKGVQWDAIFLCWCANQAGISPSIIPPSKTAEDLYKSLQSCSAESVKMGKPGDIVIWNSSFVYTSVKRSGIIYKLNNDSTQMYLYEGDNNGEVTAGRKLSVTDPNIIAILRPRYSTTPSQVTFETITDEQIKTLKFEVAKHNNLTESGKKWFEQHPEMLFFVQKDYGGYSPSGTNAGNGLCLPNCVPYAWGRACWVWSQMIEQAGYLTNQEMMVAYNEGKPFSSGLEYLNLVYNFEQFCFANAEDTIEKMQYMGTQRNSKATRNYKTLSYVIPWQVDSSRKHHGFQGTDGKTVDTGMDIYAYKDEYIGATANSYDGMVLDPKCVPIRGSILVYASGALHKFLGKGTGDRWGHVAFVEDFQANDNLTISESMLGDSWMVRKLTNYNQFKYSIDDFGDNDKQTHWRHYGDYFLGFIYPPEECGGVSYGRFKFKSLAFNSGIYQIKNRLWVI